MQRYTIASIPGDGIGIDTIHEAVATLETVSAVHGGLTFTFDEYPWSCRYYLEHGRMMPEDGLTILADHDCILFGAAGFPTVPDHISLWGLLLPIRQAFDQYINLRPVKLLRGIAGPLRGKGPTEIDMVCIRENTEGEYAGIGGRSHRGGADEVAVQTAVFTRKGVERVLRYAFEVARTRPARSLASATKSNALQYSMVFWDEVFVALQPEYPDVTCRQYHVDALAARFVTAPESLDVVVGSNLFGDILTDLGGALQGSLGIPPSGNINPEGRYPSLFEPVHGSAPDIAGKGIANPIAAIWAASMLLDHLGHTDCGALVLEAIERVTAEGHTLTPDLGGNATTQQMGEAIRAEIVSLGQL
ncbi:MAG: tartrate dehydrogenase [Chloroflexi bacterium]|jgi:tartrate dehydrogenase/decarboxylase/D-malate dehydrogenase|nr:tartrate dehydrogenase [Chloroflexota bacterium]